MHSAVVLFYSSLNSLFVMPSERTRSQTFILQPDIDGLALCTERAGQARRDRNFRCFLGCKSFCSEGSFRSWASPHLKEGFRKAETRGPRRGSPLGC